MKTTKRFIQDVVINNYFLKNIVNKKFNVERYYSFKVLRTYQENDNIYLEIICHDDSITAKNICVKEFIPKTRRALLEFYDEEAKRNTILKGMREIIVDGHNK